MPSEWACHDSAAASITDKVCITSGVDEMILQRQKWFIFWDQCNATLVEGSPVNGLVMTLIDQWRLTRYVSLVWSPRKLNS